MEVEIEKKKAVKARALVIKMYGCNFITIIYLSIGNVKSLLSLEKNEEQKKKNSVV